MKRLLISALLLCLVLAGCALTPPEEAPLEPPVLPTPAAPETWDPPAPRGPEASAVPVPELGPDGMLLRISGPAGTVETVSYSENVRCCDPIYADVDGDGALELIFFSPDPISGVYSPELWVYGLEQGWPAAEAHRMVFPSLSFALSDSSAVSASASNVFGLLDVSGFGLELEEDRAVFRAAGKKVQLTSGDEGRLVDATVRLPLTVRNGQILLGEEEASEAQFGFSGYLGYGASLSALRAAARSSGNTVLLDLPNCLVWRDSVEVLRLDVTGNPEQVPESGTWTNTFVFAVVSDNGVTVTGTCTFTDAGGLLSLMTSPGTMDLIPAVEDPEALVGLTSETLTERLGPAHFTGGGNTGAGGSLFPCWFTKDGKLVLIRLHEGKVSGASLRDLFASEPFSLEDGSCSEGGSADPEETDLVTVDLSGIPTRITGRDRWERFLETAAAGKADAITLRLVYTPDSFDLPLSYDGERYTLIDEGIVTTCKYLIASEDTAPRPSAQYRRAVHYLLSDDPEATWEECFSRMLSSSAPIGVEETPMRSLFSVYE